MSPVLLRCWFHLVEVFCILQHLIHDLPAVIAFRATDYKLFNLLKLMDPAGTDRWDCHALAGGLKRQHASVKVVEGSSSPPVFVTGPDHNAHRNQESISS